MDEIDANLDAEYRKSISQLIAEFSGSSQFIVTTFRPELISQATTVYGVTFGNRISDIERIDKKEALEFVEQVDR